MDVLKERIGSIVKDVILEWGGVSDKVDRMSLRVVDIIKSQHRDYPRDSVRVKTEFGVLAVPCKKFTLDLSEDDEIDSSCGGITVTLFFYDRDSVISADDLRRIIADNGMLRNVCRTSDNAITLSLIWPSDDNTDDGTEVSERNLGSISHELMHAYQGANSAFSGHKDGHIYRLADKYIDEPFGSNPAADRVLKQLIDSWVPWIIYRFDRAEVDAYIQQMYYSCKRTGEDIRDSRIYKDYAKSLSDYDKVKRCYDGEEGNDIKEFTEASISRICKPREFFRICDKRVDYIRSKLMKVVGKYYSSEGHSTGSFRRYAENEIAPDYNFNGYTSDERRKSRFAKMADKILKWRRGS